MLIKVDFDGLLFIQPLNGAANATHQILQLENCLCFMKNMCSFSHLISATCFKKVMTGNNKKGLKIKTAFS